jgi:hypothetical protein
VGDVAHILEVHAMSIFRVIVVNHAKTSAITPTTIQYNNPKIKLMSIMNYCESLKSGKILYK